MWAYEPLGIYLDLHQQKTGFEGLVLHVDIQVEEQHFLEDEECNCNYNYFNIHQYLYIKPPVGIVYVQLFYHTQVSRADLQGLKMDPCLLS